MLSPIDSQLARDAFATFIPISVESDARTKIIFDFFDLMSAIAAHGKSNGLTGRKLSRYAGWWAFEISDSGKGFDTGYKSWSRYVDTEHILTFLANLCRAADATSHLFFAYLRSLSPDSVRGTNGILALPLSLQTLVQATEYPPETPSLMQNTTTKVVMIVDAVSPTPFALLRRAKNFEYRDDDRALKQFSDFEDPVNALTDECRRVLKCISSTNQSTVSTSKASTSLRDASWSRFEDIGFGGSIEESDHEDEVDGSALGSKRNSPRGMKPTANSRYYDMGRPTTPSWADFLSSGFADDGANKSPRTLLLPPDKVLPPINTMRVQSSQSHRRMNDNDSTLEPGELASINTIDLDDSFWWVWISSLAGEEPTSRKGAFGRCALIETKIPGGKWLIMEEQVKGAAPEPAAGAYIAEKKGFFGFTAKKGRLTRRKSAIKKSILAPPDESLKDRDRTTIKTNIGLDQHARIQAAAAALQQKHREQAAPQNGTRRGRDDGSESKTNSVFTLQPVIVNEASPAMKWASQYDKNEIRSAYLGNSNAGRGVSTENLTATANGVKNKENVPLRASNGSKISNADKDRDLPALPRETPKASQYDLPATAKEQPFTPPPLPNTPVVNLEAKQVAAEAAKVPLPSQTPLAPKAQENKLPMTPKEDQPDDVQDLSRQRTADGKDSSETTSEKHSSPKRLTKKSRNSGIKGMFGRKKDEPEPQRQVSPESSAAVAAARAALEGRTKPTINPSPTPSAPISNKSNRLSGLRKKAPQPQIAPPPPPSQAPVKPAAHTPLPIAEEEITPVISKSPELPLQTPLSSHPPDSFHEPERPDLSRVTTNERLHADREFSSFDQGPLVEQPAFVPGDSPSTTPGAITPVREQPQEPAPAPPTIEEETKEENPPRSISPVQDRWAQIRKNAAERAARQSEEQSRRSQTERTDDGETSGEESKYY
jgi:hypothetical protein